MCQNLPYAQRCPGKPAPSCPLSGAVRAWGGLWTKQPDGGSPFPVVSVLCSIPTEGVRDPAREARRCQLLKNILWKDTLETRNGISRSSPKREEIQETNTPSVVVI